VGDVSRYGSVNGASLSNTGNDFISLYVFFRLNFIIRLPLPFSPIWIAVVGAERSVTGLSPPIGHSATLAHVYSARRIKGTDLNFLKMARRSLGSAVRLMPARCFVLGWSTHESIANMRCRPQCDSHSQPSVSDRTRILPVRDVDSLNDFWPHI